MWGRGEKGGKGCSRVKSPVERAPNFVSFTRPTMKALRVLV